MALFRRSSGLLTRSSKGCAFDNFGNLGAIWSLMDQSTMASGAVSTSPPIYEGNRRKSTTPSAQPGLGTARDVLNVKGEQFYSTRFDATVLEAVKKMVKHNIGSLIVTDDKERPMSMFTERDYLEKVTVLGRSSNNTLVKDVMSAKEFTFVGPTQSLLETMEFMTSRKIRHVPVVEGEKVLGMISIGDVVKELVDVHRKEKEDMQKYISGGY